MDSQKKAYPRWIRVLTIAGFLSLTPLAFSPSRGVDENLACGAGDSCVFEPGSVCMGDGLVLYDHYLKQTSSVQ